MARYRRRVSGKFVASAVAVGLLLAVAQGHGHPGRRSWRLARSQLAASGTSNEALANRMAASGVRVGPAAEATCLDDLWTAGVRRHLVRRP